MNHALKLSGIALACFALASQSQPLESPLAVTNAIVQRSEDSPGITPSFKFLPGESVHFTFQVAGFKKTPATETQPSKISLSYSVRLLDSAGTLLAPPASDQVDVELNTEDKDWAPKRRVSFQLPALIAAGTDQIRVSVKDEIGKTETSREFSLPIGGPVVLPADTVGIQAVHFFRNENDREPLELAAYQAGDTVLAHFRIVGFKKGDENRYQLSYRVKVLRPDGKPFIRDPQDINLESKTFYPAPYLNEELGLTTSKDAAKGQYRLTISVRDVIAGTQNDFNTSFSIE